MRSPARLNLHAIRSRWPLLLLTTALVFLLRPTPLATPLATPLRAAGSALADGRSEPALAHLEAALLFLPDMPGVQTAAARAALASGQPERAIQYMAASGVPRLPGSETACLWAQAQLQLGDLERASAAWNEAGASCSGGAEFLAQLGRAELAAGKIEEARATFERWTRLEPASAEARSELGLAAAVIDPASALPHLRLAEDLAGERSLLRLDLIRAIQDSGDVDEPAYSLAQVGQVFARHGEWNLAALAFERALLLEPGYAEAEAYLGLALDRSGRDGLAHLQAAATEAPEAALPHALLGMHWRAAGDLERALTELARSLDLDPENPAVLAELGAAYAGLGQFEAAKEAYLSATNLDPDEPAFWLLLARFSLDYEVEVETLAVPAARNALLADPESAEACDAMGYAYFLLGVPALAQRFLERALALDVNLAAAHFHLGLLLRFRGDTAEAESAFKAAAALDPDGPAGALARRALQTPRP